MGESQAGKKHPQPSAGLWSHLPGLRGLRAFSGCRVHHSSHHSVSAALPAFAFEEPSRASPASRASNPARASLPGGEQGSKKDRRKTKKNKISTKAANERLWSCVAAGLAGVELPPSHLGLPGPCHLSSRNSSRNSQLFLHPRPLRTFLYSVSSPFPPWCSPNPALC